MDGVAMGTADKGFMGGNTGRDKGCAVADVGAEGGGQREGGGGGGGLRRRIRRKSNRKEEKGR